MTQLLLLLAVSLLPFVALRTMNEPGLAWTRDRLCWAGFGLAASAAVWQEPWLAPMAAAVCWRWRTPAALPSVVAWAGIAAVWFTVPAVGSIWRAVAEVAWPMAGLGLGLLMLGQRIRAGHANGVLAQRTLAGAMVALLLPFAVATPLRWLGLGALAMLSLALVLTSSWLAALAAGAGLVTYAPWTAWLLVPALGVGLVCLKLDRGHGMLSRYTARGNSLDSVKERLRTWTMTCLQLGGWRDWLLGHGPDTYVKATIRWSAQARVSLTIGHAHCDPLESLYEWGCPFVLTLVGLGLRLWPHLHSGDPWSATAVTGAVLACGTLLCRVAPLGVVWWIALAVVAHN